MKVYIFIFSLLFAIITVAKAQVGINNPMPDSTSVLDLKSVSQGFLIPRMNSSQRNNIVSPANSLLVFDTDIKKFIFWNSTNSQWVILNPWYAEENGTIHYGATNNDFKINIAPTGGNSIFRIHSPFNEIFGNTTAFQTEFIFQDYLVATSGIRLNAKVSGGNFILLQAFYNNFPVMTLKSNGNLGLGYTNPTKKLEVNGEIKASGTITADNFNGKGFAPIGSIVMWSGSISNIPSGWVLCNGTNGTPNLTERFVVGAGSSYSVNNTGGEARVTLIPSEIPPHSHTGSTDTTGSHTHFVVRNEYKDDGASNSIAWRSNQGYGLAYDLFSHSNIANWGKTNKVGKHHHSLYINNAGGGQSHENRPAFYALAFIMRTN